MIPSIVASTRFKWPVSTAGYTLRTVEIPKWYRSPAGYMLDWDEQGVGREIIGRRHGERVMVEKGTKSLRYQTPLEDGALFMNFGRLDRTEEAILAFASKYGFLDSRADAHRPERDESPDAEEWGESEDAYGFSGGESLDTWYARIALMQIGIYLWTQGREGPRRRLDYRHVLKSFASFFDEPGSDGIREKISALRTTTDALRLAHSIAIDEFAGGFGSPGMGWSFTEVLPHRRHVLQIAPDTLGTGLFLQFALAMAADSDYRSCERCGSFYDGTTSRRSRKYCSDSCKTRAYNERHISMKR